MKPKTAPSPLVELFAEVWLMEPSALARLLAVIGDVAMLAPDAQTALSLDPTQRKPGAAQVVDGVARIPIAGPILKSRIPVLDKYAITHTGAADVRREVRAAAADPAVTAIVLEVDSPGGTVSGVAELADEVASVNDKPVTAEVSGMCASAAYWIASQADHITATRGSFIGSIGTYSTIMDASRMFEDFGIKIHVLSSHELKGAGVMGAKVSDNQLADMQRIIDQLTESFVAGVADGRGMGVDKAKESATGQVWLAPEAMARGLIDAVSGPAPKSKVSPSTSSGGARHQEGNTMKVEAAAPATQDTAMADENKKLREELAQKDAQLEAQSKSLDEVTKAQREQVIAAAVADGRVTPEMRASVDKLAEAHGADVAGFSAAIAGWPKHTRPEPVGSSEVAPAATEKKKPTDPAAQAKEFADQARAYQAEMQAKGIEVSTRAALDHVMQAKS